jgi:putative sterol carrier protein
LVARHYARADLGSLEKTHPGAALGRRVLEKAKGAARFEVVDGKQTERWLVTIDKGHISVSRRNAHADTVVRASKESFERAAAGRLNLMAAVLRGEIGVSGDPRMLVMLQRLFPRSGDSR